MEQTHTFNSYIHGYPSSGILNVGELVTVTLEVETNSSIMGSIIVSESNNPGLSSTIDVKIY